MSNMEEQLWAYIDGTCTAQERAQIAQQIAQSEQLRLQYEELLHLHQEFGELELDEPAMAFTYNVMENIRAEEALKPLKAGINVHVIRFISVFFILIIAMLLVFIVANLGMNNELDTQVPVIRMDIQNIINQQLSGIFLKCLVLFDVIAALFFTDAWLRRKKRTTTAV